jgi:hypothetical protein
MTGFHVGEPKQAVELWILGVNNRSGAVQYAMSSPSLQKQSRRKFELYMKFLTGGEQYTRMKRCTKSNRNYVMGN